MLVIKLSGEVLFEIGIVDHSLFLVLSVQGIFLEDSDVEGVDFADLLLAYSFYRHHSWLLCSFGVNVYFHLFAS